MQVSSILVAVCRLANMLAVTRRWWWLLLLCISISHVTYAVAAVTLPDGSAIFSCADHFTLHNSFCYRYFGPEVRKAFHHAQKQCSRYQSALVSLYSVEEEEFVVGLTQNQSAFWIGLNDEDGPKQTHKEGYFKWSTGEEDFHVPSSYCRWKQGEPANRRHLDCVKVDVDGWAMAPGGCAASKLSFVCKKEACPLDLCAPGSSEGQAGRSTMVTPTLLVLGLLIVAALLICIPRFGKRTDMVHHRTKELPQELFPT